MHSSPLGPAAPPRPLAPPTHGASSLKPQAAGTGAAERSQTAPRPLNGMARARFESIQRLSTVAEGVPATQDEDEDEEVLYTSANIDMHRDDLIAALTRPAGPHAAQAEKSLKALIAENQDHDTSGPTKLHLYLGLGEVDSAHLQENSALAKQLRKAAAEVWGQLDPECKQMLDWITQEWKAYESASVPVGLRLAKSRQPTEGPRTREVLEWSAHAGAVDDLWANPTTVLRREAERNELVLALIEHDTPKITEILQDIPDVMHLNRHFPPAGLVSEVYVCEMLHKAAHQYNREHQHSRRRSAWTVGIRQADDELAGRLRQRWRHLETVERMRQRTQTVYESLLQSKESTVEKHAIYAVFQQIVQTARQPH